MSKIPNTICPLCLIHRGYSDFCCDTKCMWIVKDVINERLACALAVFLMKGNTDFGYKYIGEEVKEDEQ